MPGRALRAPRPSVGELTDIRCGCPAGVESVPPHPGSPSSAAGAIGPTPHLAGSRAEASLGLDQPAPDRVPRQLDTVAHAELVEDVLAVAVDGLDADEQGVGDL